MCFSATASFVASGALAAAGAASLTAAKKQERLIALIPLLFAVQQAVEGAQWLMPHQSAHGQLLGYAYLFFAFLLWPVYIPCVVYRLETERRYKKFLGWLAALGLFVSSGLFIILTAYPLAISTDEGHVLYDLPAASALVSIGTVLYTLAVVGSLLASSRRELKLFGIAVFIAEIAAAVFFLNQFPSVWCFFAAALSALVCLFFLKRWNERFGSGTMIVKDTPPTKAG